MTAVSCSGGGCAKKTEAIDPSTETKVRDETSDTSGDKVVGLVVADGRTEADISKQPGQIVYIEFLVEGFRKLAGKITASDQDANVRFAQIFLPDGTTDGPFDREIEYDLPSDGRYRIKIGESLMAGDPWGGDFKVEITLSGSAQ